jgi:hypothetical protein
MSEPDTAPLRKLVLAELRCAYLRAKSAENEIEFIASALHDDLITPADAIEALEQQGWTGFMTAEVMLKIRKACGADVG